MNLSPVPLWARLSLLSVEQTFHLLLLPAQPVRPEDLHDRRPHGQYLEDSGQDQSRKPLDVLVFYPVSRNTSPSSFGTQRRLPTLVIRPRHFQLSRELGPGIDLPRFLLSWYVQVLGRCRTGVGYTRPREPWTPSSTRTTNRLWPSRSLLLPLSVPVSSSQCRTSWWTSMKGRWPRHCSRSVLCRWTSRFEWVSGSTWGRCPFGWKGGIWVDLW